MPRYQAGNPAKKKMEDFSDQSIPIYQMEVPKIKSLSYGFSHP
jgi:hypothetical protein